MLRLHLIVIYEIVCKHSQSRVRRIRSSIRVWGLEILFSDLSRGLKYFSIRARPVQILLLEKDSRLGCLSRLNLNIYSFPYVITFTLQTDDRRLFLT